MKSGKCGNCGKQKRNILALCVDCGRFGSPLPLTGEKRYIVRWCSSLCRTNPHLTREDAQAYVEKMYEGARKSPSGMYGHYSIEEVDLSEVPDS